MLYRLALSMGLFALGFYLGREVGRTESIRERMRQVRESGGSMNLRDAIVIDMDPSVADEEQQPTKH